MLLLNIITVKPKNHIKQNHISIIFQVLKKKKKITQCVRNVTRKWRSFESPAMKKISNFNFYLYILGSIVETKYDVEMHSRGKNLVKSFKSMRNFGMDELFAECKKGRPETRWRGEEKCSVRLVKVRYGSVR